MRPFNRLMTSAALGAIALAVPAVSATAAQKKDEQATAPKRNLSKEFVAALQPYEKALAAKDYATASAAVTAARAVAKTPDEKYIADRVALNIATDQKDEAAQTVAMNGILASGAAPQNEVALFNSALASRAFNAKDTTNAMRYAAAARAAGSTNPDLALIEAQSYANLNDYPKAIAAFEKIIAARKAAGETVDQSFYARNAQLAQKAGDQALLDKSLLAWVTAYPSSKTWHDVLINSMAAGKYPSDVQLDYLRLMRAAQALNTAEEYRSYAQLASYDNLNGEVIAVVDAGTGAGVLQPGDTAEVYGQAKSKSAEDQASLKREIASASSKTAAKPVTAAADALAGYGDYANAISLYKIAADKPGADANELNLKLGVAQAMSSQYADAKASFAKVTGPRQVLATYWTVWLDKRQAG